MIETNDHLVDLRVGKTPMGGYVNHFADKVCNL